MKWVNETLYKDTILDMSKEKFLYNFNHEIIPKKWGNLNSGSIKELIKIWPPLSKADFNGTFSIEENTINFTGRWLDGEFKGTMSDSSFINGVFVDGIFKDSTFDDGIFKNGTFIESVFSGGTFENGIFENSCWELNNDTQWIKGEWKEGRYRDTDNALFMDTMLTPDIVKPIYKKVLNDNEKVSRDI